MINEHFVRSILERTATIIIEGITELSHQCTEPTRRLRRLFTLLRRPLSSTFSPLIQHSSVSLQPGGAECIFICSHSCVLKLSYFLRRAASRRQTCEGAEIQDTLICVRISVMKTHKALSGLTCPASCCCHESLSAYVTVWRVWCVLLMCVPTCGKAEVTLSQ